MITVEEAEQIVLENTLDFGIEYVPIEEALGKVLAEDLIADRDFPPFNRVTMDGVAICFEKWEKGQKNFKVEAISAAGSPQNSLKNPKNCIEIMTGSIVPNNCDTIVRYEDLMIENGFATIQVSTITKGQNIHRKGKDRKENDIIILKGKIISPAEIGVAATLGRSKILVRKMPKIMIISTGDELISIDKKPLPHQIRTSNGYAIQAALKSWGIAATTVHLKDEEKLIESHIKQFLQTYHVLIFSGGVSAGKFDFIPQVLDNQGVKKLFHQITQRPGKPFLFGKKENIRDENFVENFVVFALPGNPVSSFMCLHRYFKPWLNASLGIENKICRAELTEDVLFKADLTYFLQVKIEERNAFFATPISGNGSGDLANLADADAFLELPKGRELFKKGEFFPFFPYR